MNIMKTLFLIVFTLMVTGHAIGQQYYYKDLVLPTELTQKRAQFQASKVKGVRFKSFDNRNQPIEGFSCTQTVSSNFLQLKTVTKDPLTGASESIAQFDEKGRLIQTTDTTEGNRTVVTYRYDAGGRIAAIHRESYSPGQYVSKETHLWYYDEAGRPQRMVRIKNEKDSVYFRFVLDEKGNVVEENPEQQSRAESSVYYYYDDAGRLTDVVRYNRRAQRLLPDYVFEYDAENRLHTMLVTIEGTGDYQKWYYTYNEKGLRAKDECFSKTRVLIGRIEYEYLF